MYKQCLQCGNNPVNHRLHKVSQSINHISVPLISYFESRKIKKVLSGGEVLSHGMLESMSLIKVIKFSNELHPTTTNRSKVMWNEAKNRNIEIQQIHIFNSPTEQFRASIDGKWTYFTSLPIKSSESGAYAWLDNKWRLKQFLLKHKLATPIGFLIKDEDSLTKALSLLPKPVVIKPVAGSRGRHTSTLIRTESEAHAAFITAKQLCRYIIVEQMLHGSVYRATYVNGKIVAVLRGDVPSVIGDGIKSIEKLIKIKNHTRLEGIAKLSVNGSLVSLLGRQDMSLEHIPGKGEIILLGEKIGVRYGGGATDVTSEVNPKIIKELERAGKTINAPVIGFDFIIPNPKENPDNQVWGIIEANGLPFIDLHHFPHNGKPVNVAAAVWDAFLT